MTSNQKSKEKVAFEDRLKQLETIVDQLESDVPLDKAVMLYQEGSQLIQSCQTELQQAEALILKLVEVEGTPKAIPLEQTERLTLF